MGSVVKFKKPVNSTATTQASPLRAEAALIRECVAYAQAVAAAENGFRVDPDGNSTYASKMSNPYRRRLAKALKVITRTPAKSAAGLQAKARIVPMIIEDAVHSLDEREEAFFLGFAADVKAYLEPTIHEQWLTEKGVNKSAQVTP